MVNKRRKFVRFKLYAIILAITSFNSVYSQKIDSLISLKNKYSNKIKVLQDSILLIEKQIELSLEKKNYIFFDSTAKINEYTITVKKGYLKEKADFFSAYKGELKEGDSVFISEITLGKDGLYHVKINNGYYVLSECVKFTDNIHIAIKQLDNAIQKNNDKRLELLNKEHNDQYQKKLKYLQSIYGTKIGDRIAKGEIWIGMSRTQFKEVKGEPTKINRSVYTFGVHEQWIYGEIDASYYYFENNILKAWQHSKN